MVSRRSIVAILAVCAAATAGPNAFQRYSKQQGDRFQAKLTRIVVFGTAPAASERQTSQTTDVTDDELNSYLRFQAGAQIPAGIVEPTLNALGDGRVGGRVIVDLDAVRKQKQRGWLDPMGYLTGQLPVTAAGRLTTKDGVGQVRARVCGGLGHHGARRRSSRNCSHTTRGRLRTRRASTWTSRSNCRRASRKSA